MKTKISDLKVGQRVWWFDKYGTLKGGEKGCLITKLEPNKPHPCGEDMGVYDEVSLDIEEIQKYEYVSVKVKENKKNGTSSHKLTNKRRVDKLVVRKYGICAKQTLIYTSNPRGVVNGRLCFLVENLHSDINDLYLAMDGGKCSDDDVLRSLSGISKYLDEQLDEI